MSYLNKNNYRKTSEYNVIYSNMRGVDFSENGSSISRNRFSYLENMYRDYDGDGAGVTESIPGYRKVFSFDKKINGLYTYKNSDGHDIVVAHAECELHEFYLADVDTVLETTSVSGIQDCESHAFTAKDALYILDGKNIYKMSKSFRGKITADDADIYIPTTYINGEEYEQRNLLTRAFYERFNIGSCDSAAFGTPSLKYAVTDSEGLKCKVTGMSGSEEDIYIPSRVLIGDKYYSVTCIESRAFQNNTTIKNCYIANGISLIGDMAFSGCYNLVKVVLPDSITEIGVSCFGSCTALAELHLGLALRTLGASVINTCPSLNTITYSGTESDFAKIENTSFLGSAEIIYNTVIKDIKIGIKVYDPCISVESIKIDNNDLQFETISSNGLIEEVTIYLDDKSLYEGKEAIILGTLSSDPEKYRGIHSSFMTSNYISGTEVSEAILSCKIAESFDGRVFLSGNPSYPGFCFYSSFDISGDNNPLYFGELNYFKDGVGNFNNIALLAAGDSLAVFKERDDGGGSIYYHTPESTNADILPRIYPVSYVHTGFSAKGNAISFFDDPVFVSSKGISALAKKSVNLERSIVTRSGNINPKFLSEDLSAVKLAVWRGYLAVMVNGRIYLADSRATFTSDIGEIQYEWYYLSNIGSWKGDKRVYRYASISHTGYDLHDNTDGIAEGEVFGAYADDELVYYIQNGEKKYEVYPTEEFSGGDFYPATHILAIEDSLLFGTEAGDICIFNNDKRGIAPPYIAQGDNFDKEEYKKSYGRRIHPYYYSFASHAPRYAIQTKNDDCSIPHLAKNTIKDSLSLKCRAISSGKLTCEVGTDNKGYTEICKFPNQDIFFGDMDFSSLSMITQDVYTVPVRERTKNWIEKQITLYSEEYGSPFGIYMIAYRFFVKGKIKKGR